MTSPDTPQDYDPLAHLTIGELDAGSRKLGASLVATITGQGPGYERALALVAWLHARRHDPAVTLESILELTFVELSERLGSLGPQTEEAGPTPRVTA